MTDTPTQSTHWDGCWRDHPGCAIEILHRINEKVCNGLLTDAEFRTYVKKELRGGKSDD